MSPSPTADLHLLRDQRTAFDCVRGVLAFMLVILHMGQLDIGVLPDAWMHQRLISVGIFFTLSGFLVTRSMLLKPSFDRLAFAKARVQRIYPSYLLCLFFALTISDANDLFGVPVGAAVGNLLSHLTLTHAWFDGHSSGILPPLWTLSHEWGFYAFILGMAGVLRSKHWWVAVAVVMLGAMVSRYGLKKEWFELANDYRHPFCIMDFFAPGITAAVLLQKEKVQRWVRSRQGLVVMLAAGAALIGWALHRHYSVALRIDDARFDGMGFYFAFEKLFLKDRSSLLFYQPALACGSALLLVALWTHPAWVARLLRYTPLPWMGKVSYSTYLWHMMVVICFTREQKRIPEGSLWEHPWALFLASLAAIYALSAVTWEFLEKPFLRRRGEGPPAMGAVSGRGVERPVQGDGLVCKGAEPS